MGWGRDGIEEEDGKELSMRVEGARLVVGIGRQQAGRRESIKKEGL